MLSLLFPETLWDSLIGLHNGLLYTIAKVLIKGNKQNSGI